MKAIFKSCVIVGAVIVLVPLLLSVIFVINLAHIEFRMYSLRHADHSRILSACREAIANRNSYRNDRDKWGTGDKDDVLLLSPISDDIPEAIRELKPHNVLIREDYAMIDLGLPFRRICILGFKPGAKQFGTFKYIDGLWFWDGDDNTKKEKSQQ